MLDVPENDRERVPVSDDLHSDPFLQNLHHALAGLQREQEDLEQEWLTQIQQNRLQDTTPQREHDIPARSFQSRVRGLQDWFARKSLRDLKIVLFLYEANREDTEHEFSLDEMAHALQMARSTMKMAAIDGGLITSGVIQQTRHGRPGYRYRSGLLAFLYETFPEHDQLELLLPLLFYDTIKRRTKTTDPWLIPWLERYEQDLHHIRQEYHL